MACCQFDSAGVGLCGLLSAWFHWCWGFWLAVSLTLLVDWVPQVARVQTGHYVCMSCLYWPKKAGPEMATGVFHCTNWIRAVNWRRPDPGHEYHHVRSMYVYTFLRTTVKSMLTWWNTCMVATGSLIPRLRITRQSLGTRLGYCVGLSALKPCILVDTPSPPPGRKWTGGGRRCGGEEIQRRACQEMEDHQNKVSCSISRLWWDHCHLQ